MAALINVSDIIWHRLKCPIEVSRTGNAVEKQHISCRPLGGHLMKLSCSAWPSGDRAAITAYDFTSLPMRSSISDNWIDRKELRTSRQLNTSGRNTGYPADSRSIVSRVMVWSYSSESRAVRSCLGGSLNFVPLNGLNHHVLQEAGEHIGGYPLQAGNVAETAAGFVANQTRTACWWDRDRQ